MIFQHLRGLKERGLNIFLPLKKGDIFREGEGLSEDLGFVNTGSLSLRFPTEFILILHDILLITLFQFVIAVENPDLKAGVTSLSKLLSLPEHPDHFVLLQVTWVNIYNCISLFAFYPCFPEIINNPANC